MGWVQQWPIRPRAVSDSEQAPQLEAASSMLFSRFCLGDHSVNARFGARIVTYTRKVSVLHMIETTTSKVDIERA